MALESATYIDGLNTANPAGGDPMAQADDHIRLLKTTIKATFPNITGPVTATQTDINQLTGKTVITTTGSQTLDGKTLNNATFTGITTFPTGTVIDASGNLTVGGTATVNGATTLKASLTINSNVGVNYYYSLTPGTASVGPKSSVFNPAGTSLGYWGYWTGTVWNAVWGENAADVLFGANNSERMRLISGGGVTVTGDLGVSSGNLTITKSGAPTQGVINLGSKSITFDGTNFQFNAPVYSNGVLLGAGGGGGGGTITGVTAGSGLSGGGTTGSVTLSLSTSNFGGVGALAFLSPQALSVAAGDTVATNSNGLKYASVASGGGVAVDAFVTSGSVWRNLGGAVAAGGAGLFIRVS